VIFTTSSGILRIKALPELLADEVKLYRKGGSAARAVVGWGMKPTAEPSRVLAARLALPYWSLEDGFLRSVGVGQEEHSFSVVVDDLGIYYDAGRSSRLEAMVLQDLHLAACQRARPLAETWCAARVSKYNYARDLSVSLPEPYVLVADQTFGDASIRYGLANAGSFALMLEAALSENPDSMVVLKVHPEVMLGRKTGHFDVVALQKHPRVLVLGEDVHAAGLIAGAEAVYVVTSQMGFEGLLWGKRVRTFGMPFYAGWALTEDEMPAPVRRRPVPLENLVHAALVDYPRYVDPETGKRCEPERVIEWMGLQRRMRTRFPADLYAVGFSDWKKPIIRDYCQGSQVHFVKKLEKVPDGAMVIAWGTKGLALMGQRPVVCLEDAFLRSVGLGADLVRPLSWVMDTQGMYYDATRPSTLENIYLETVFDEALLARSAALRQRIVDAGLTKYNVGKGAWQRPLGKQRVILVPGQVESDASIAYGAPEGVCQVRQNMALLRAVREANPDAWVVYKPHPDVLAGLRIRGQDESLALQWCDEQVIDASMGELLAQVDEVHVITSLAGFEALLRGKRVVCYGQPFYAGWGLTEDKAPLARRTRRLSLDELVAGALILYPTYVSRTTGRFTTPERALDELLAWRESGPTTLPLWRKALRMVLRFYKR
jgi:capsular polysaccharide export protein